MKALTFRYNNKLYTSFTREDAEEINIPEDVIQKAEQDNKWSDIRNKRDYLMTSCDWTQIPDASLTDEMKSKYTAYRQALRDIPQSHDNPDDVVWPVKPTV